MRIILSTRSYYKAEEIKAALEWAFTDVEVDSVFRDYHFSRVQSHKGMVVISDGTSKTRLSDNSESIAVYSSAAYDFAKKHELRYLPMILLAPLVWAFNIKQLVLRLKAKS